MEFFMWVLWRADSAFVRTLRWSGERGGACSVAVNMHPDWSRRERTAPNIGVNALRDTRGLFWRPDCRIGFAVELEVTWERTLSAVLALKDQTRRRRGHDRGWDSVVLKVFVPSVQGNLVIGTTRSSLCLPQGLLTRKNRLQSLEIFIGTVSFLGVEN